MAHWRVDSPPNFTWGSRNAAALMLRALLLPPSNANDSRVGLAGVWAARCGRREVRRRGVLPGCRDRAAAFRRAGGTSMGVTLRPWTRRSSRDGVGGEAARGGTTTLREGRLRSPRALVCLSPSRAAAVAIAKTLSGSRSWTVLRSLTRAMGLIKLRSLPRRRRGG